MLQSLVDIIRHGLTDENQKVKTITALSIAALAEAASPYGIESFDDVLEPLWKGIRLLRWVPGHLYLSVTMCCRLSAMSSRCCGGSWLPRLETMLMLSRLEMASGWCKNSWPPMDHCCLPCNCAWLLASSMHPGGRFA